MNEADSSAEIHAAETFRSPLLMNAHDSALVIVDVQEKLVPHIYSHEKIVWNIGRLIAGAQVLDVQTVATEQYPQGLGETVDSIRQPLEKGGFKRIPEKMMFSCRECDATFAQLNKQGIYNLLLTGIETHVCVAQSALDLIAAGFAVYICVDAVGTRNQIDHQTALRRLENSGAFLTTTEAVLFEWCEKAGSTKFKQISQLVREQFKSAD